MVKVQLRDRAIRLRKEGYLYGQIARTLHVAKSTAYLWVKDIPLTDAEDAKISFALKDAHRRAVAGMVSAKAQKHSAAQEEIVREAYEIVRGGKLDINHQRILCATMFWCEGQKDVSGSLVFINSDPVMVRSFLNLLRNGFRIDESKFRALIHLHEYHDEQKQVEYWSEITGIPSKQFYKSYIKPRTGKNI